MAVKDIRVTLYYRSPEDRGFSIERVFDSIQREFPADIHARKAFAPAHGQRPISLLRNLIDAPKHGAEVNHITGNVYYVAARLDPRRTLITIHDLAQLHRLKGVKRSIFKRFWCDMPARRSQYVTTVSEHSKREIVEFLDIDPDKVKVIYVPTDPTYRPVPKPFDEACPNILMIGTKWNKNLARQVEALERIRCQVTLVGPMNESLRKAFGNHGVSYSNFVDVSDGVLRQLYEACDLVLFASVLEGFGMPIVEANATGRPVITSNRTSMPEVAGDAAVLVDPEDAGDIRSAVLSVISRAALREQLVDRGFVNARRFDVRAIASQYANLYREVVSGRQSSDVVEPTDRDASVH